MTNLTAAPLPALNSPAGPAVVIYHRVSDVPDPLVDQLGITTAPDLFLRHMRYFAKNHDLVSVSDVAAGKLPRKPLLITFDDAYRSVLDVAGPILRSFGAPSVFFLNPGTLSRRTLPIDNLLSLAAGRLGLQETLSRLGCAAPRDSSFAQLLFGYVAGLGQARTEQLKTDILSLLGTTVAEIRAASSLFLDESDVARLAGYGIEVGNHSMTHSFFRSLSSAELEEEIVASRMLLQRMSGQVVDSLSVPYGYETDATGAALQVARRSGHRAIFLVQGRSNLYRRHKDVFYRTNPKDTSPLLMGLRLRVVPVAKTIVSRLTRTNMPHHRRAG